MVHRVKRFTVSLPETLLEKLGSRAADDGTTEAAIVRTAIAEYLETPSRRELVGRAELARAIKEHEGRMHGKG